MITLLVALTVAAPAQGPKAGHYYRAAFADSVARGTFDPDAYVTHREPSLRWTPPRLSVDFGQEILTRATRRTRTGTVTTWAMQVDGAWVPLHLRALAPDRIETDAAGAREVWVRLPSGFEELARKTRETRTAAKRAALVGRYVDASGDAVVLGPKTGFKLHTCLESCRVEARSWCVVHRRVTYRLDGDALVEVAPPPGLCPDGKAFEPKADGRRWVRVAK